MYIYIYIHAHTHICQYMMNLSPLHPQDLLRGEFFHRRFAFLQDLCQASQHPQARYDGLRIRNIMGITWGYILTVCVYIYNII